MPPVPGRARPGVVPTSSRTPACSKGSRPTAPGATTRPNASGVGCRGPTRPTTVATRWPVPGGWRRRWRPTTKRCGGSRGWRTRSPTGPWSRPRCGAIRRRDPEARAGNPMRGPNRRARTSPAGRRRTRARRRRAATATRRTARRRSRTPEPRTPRIRRRPTGPATSRRPTPPSASACSAHSTRRRARRTARVRARPRAGCPRSPMPTAPSASVAKPWRPGCAACRTIRAACCARASASNTSAAAGAGHDVVHGPVPAPAGVAAGAGLHRAGAGGHARLARPRAHRRGRDTTLNIETDQAGARMPDFSALAPDFVLSGHSSTRGSEPVAGGGHRPRVLFAVALQPRREGLLTVPALRVGAESTAPLVLTVLPDATAPARAGEPVFIEAEADTDAPWVQQSVGYTLRLYYATPLVSGQLDQPVPDGAAVHRVGSDVQYSREIAGRRYTVVERRFVLVPERSGTLVVPGARFEGTGVGGFFDDMFGGGRRALRAQGPSRVLQVQPVPASAPQPWLPLQSMQLRYLATPQELRAGEAATVDVELVADGAAASQLPELRLPPVDGAQVFPEPPQVDELFERGRPRTRVTRRFAVVPVQAGPLRLPGLRQAWWDVDAGVERTAALPDLHLEVEPGAPAAAVDDAVQAAFEAGRGDRRVHPGAWRWLAIGLAVLWLGTLAWALRERRRAGAHARRLPLVQPRGDAPAPATSL